MELHSRTHCLSLSLSHTRTHAHINTHTERERERERGEERRDRETEREETCACLSAVLCSALSSLAKATCNTAVHTSVRLASQAPEIDPPLSFRIFKGHVGSRQIQPEVKFGGLQHIRSNRANTPAQPFASKYTQILSHKHKQRDTTYSSCFCST